MAEPVTALSDIRSIDGCAKPDSLKIIGNRKAFSLDLLKWSFDHIKTMRPSHHNRKSIRLQGYDYSQAGLYFITICTCRHQCLFGEIVGGGKMVLNDAGIVANKCWLEISRHFPHAVLHEYVVMPNHIHGIIELVSMQGVNDKSPIAVNDPQPYVPVPFRSPSRTIGSIVRGFKIGVTKWFRANSRVYTVWQRNYYDHIIRSDESYFNIVEYIQNNPGRWMEDRFYRDLVTN